MADHVVVTVHGIRTYGQWQQRLENILKQEGAGTTFYNYTYGYFSIIAFLLPPLRWIITRRFRNELSVIYHKHPGARFDLVGHSFGTHLIAWGLYGIKRGMRLRIHTIILSGSVLRSTFHWNDLLVDGSVHRLINDCGCQDLVLVLSQVFVLFTGMAGRLGLHGMTSNHFTNRFFIGKHSLYFEKDGAADDAFMKKYWLPLLKEDSQIEYIDQRTAPNLMQGIMTTVLQNFEAIKLTVYAVLLLVPSLCFYGLYVEADKQRLYALDTLQWVFNEAEQVSASFDHINFAPKTTRLVTGVLERLKSTKFDGEIMFIGHVGVFKTISCDGENYSLATNEDLKTLLPGCTINAGMTEMYAMKLGGKTANTVKQIASSLGLEKNVVTVSYGKQKPSLPYPDETADPDVWNEIAAQNNRIEMQLTPNKKNILVKLYAIIFDTTINLTHELFSQK